MFFVCFVIFILSSKLSAVEVGVHIVVDDYLISHHKKQKQLKNDAEAKMAIIEEIDKYIGDTNTYYANSLVDIQLKLEQLDFRDVTSGGVTLNPDTLLSNIKNQRGVFEGIFYEEDQIGADFLGVVTHALDGVCGSAIDVNSEDNLTNHKKGSMVTNMYCGSDTFAHEFGHLMGLAHGKQVGICKKDSGHNLGITATSRGWAVSNCDEHLDAGEFGTIMVGNYLPGKIPLFSNSSLTNDLCGSTKVCGDKPRVITELQLFPVGLTQTITKWEGADSAQAMNRFKWKYAARETRDADKLAYTDVNFSSCVSLQHAHKEVNEIREINCFMKGISKVDGIEGLYNLSRVNLAENKIVNVSPLEQLNGGELAYIDLTGNNYALCHELKNLDKRFPGKIIFPQSCFEIGAFIAVTSLLI